MVQHLSSMHTVLGLIPHTATMTKDRREDLSGVKNERAALAQVPLTLKRQNHKLYVFVLDVQMIWSNGQLFKRQESQKQFP